MAFERDEERRLIRLAAAGDRDASAAFIREYQPSLRAYLLRLSGKPEVAEDIAQEAFVRVLTNLHRFDDRYRFSTWLFTIAKRLYVNARQKHAPLFNTEAVAYERSSASGPGANAASREVSTHVRDALQEALMMLGEDQREIVVLFHQLDWPITLIAQHMGMPEGTIKSHLHRSRKKLRTVLAAHVRHGSRVREAWTDEAPHSKTAEVAAR
ncbi:MAG: sigma-70 family RNA polymerase sigma factor [Planctomycetota bacterium]